MPLLRIDPFDGALAPTQTRRIPMKMVIDLLARQPHNAHRIETYRQAMLDGARFPPISVVRIGPRYVVADGHKRLAAFRSFGQREIRVETWRWRDWWRDQGRQARDHARKHGQIWRLSVTDPREALRRLISIPQHWLRVARALSGSRRPPR